MEKANRRRRFTINFKLHCIRQVELTSSIRQTAKANGMSRATLRNWVKNKSLLENVVNRSKNICLTFLSLPKINAYFVYLLLVFSFLEFALESFRCLYSFLGLFKTNSSLFEKINFPTSVSNNPFLKSKNY